MPAVVAVYSIFRIVGNGPREFSWIIRSAGDIGSIRTKIDYSYAQEYASLRSWLEIYDNLECVTSARFRILQTNLIVAISGLGCENNIFGRYLSTSFLTMLHRKYMQNTMSRTSTYLIQRDRQSYYESIPTFTTMARI